MKHYLRAYINYMQNDWTQWLSNAEFASNNIDFFNVLAFSFLINFEQHFRVRFKSKELLSQDLTIQERINLIAVN
jgi:hypothetical protein